VKSGAESKSPERDARDFIVVRLGEPIPVGNNLRAVAKRHGFGGLSRFLRQHPQIDASRVVHSVKPKRLLRLEERARDSDFAPLHSLTSYWHLDCGPIREQVPALVKRLNALPEVDLAYRALRASDPTTVVNPGSNPLYGLGKQPYLSNGKPIGINAVQGWLQSNGAGIGFADVERTWCAGHQDLFPVTGPALSCGAFSGATLIAGDNEPTCHFESRNHGSAVLGVVVGQNNTFGGVGVAPGAGPVRLASRFVHDTTKPDPCAGELMKVTNAIAAAIAALARGDVLLLEVQRDDPIATGGVRVVPTEFDAGDFTAIRLASALGIIVVEAAANGGLDLDTLAEFGPSARQSGAILVGASKGAVSPTAPGTQDRLPTSNFGARVDCYAWGAGVATAGHQPLDEDDPPTAETTWYTEKFGGTSAASAIIAGAALVVQGAFSKLAPAGRRLSPASMRALLSNPAFGTPCSSPSQNIGSMPDLQLVLQQIGSLPDLFIRDNVGDDGSIPAAGAISISPDVVVSPTNVGPAAAFTAAGTLVTLGQKNFVNVRVSNRNAQAAPGAKVRVYWSEVATLITPLSWKPVSSTPGVVDVPALGSLVSASTITWEIADLPPAAGHYCFVASVSHPRDPEPLTAPFGPGSFSWDDFMQYIRLNNNVTWRNFEVVELATGGEGGAAPLPFLVAGAPDEGRVFDLLITLDRPSAVRVAWQVPLTLLRALSEAGFEKIEIDEKKQRATVFLPARTRIRLSNVRLKKSARHPCRFLLDAAPALKTRPATLAIAQFHRQTEVGRITWELRSK
jgi:serine protease